MVGGNDGDILSSVPIKVSRVTIDGIHKTKKSFIEEKLSPIYSLRYLHQVASFLSSFGQTLDGLDIVKSFSVHIDKCSGHVDGKGCPHENVNNEKLPSHSDSIAVPIDISIRVEEKNHSLKAGTEWRRDETAFVRHMCMYTYCLLPRTLEGFGTMSLDAEKS